MMIAMNLPERTVQNLIYYTNEFLDNTCSLQFKREAEQDKNRMKKAVRRANNNIK